MITMRRMKWFSIAMRGWVMPPIKDIDWRAQTLVTGINYLDPRRIKR